MKRPSSLLLTCCLFILISCHLISQAQIMIQNGPEVTPNDMVENILGDGVIYDNVTYQGADIARGIFTNADSTNLGMSSGIFLTSGSGNIIPGPNNSGSAGVNNGMPGNSIFMICTSSTTYDASVLAFDVYPSSDTLKFRYVFGSEEYNDYVNSSFNDVFGFFVSGPNPTGGYYQNQNMAIVPGTNNLFVSINNVNNGYAPNGIIPTGPCENCQYFQDNTGGMTLQYDGLTVVLTAWVPVVSCEVYHLVLGVADAGDGIFDSGIFIEENSITSPTVATDIHLVPPDIVNSMVEGNVEGNIVFKIPSADFAPMTLNWDLSLSTAIPSGYPAGDFTDEIPTSITFDEGQDSAFINVVPVKDGYIEGDESLVFIIEENLGCMVWYDTVEYTILDYQNMNATTSPSTMICSGQEVDLWVNVYSGFPPYSYLWEPGGFTNDTITVSPEETTTYKVIYKDVFQEIDSSTIEVIAMPLNYNILSFSFEKANNPQLPWNVTGQIFEDSVSLDVPVGTNLNNLVASFSLSESAWAYVNGELQESGITTNNFSNLLTYEVNAPGGCLKDWVVNVNLITGNQDEKENKISIFPNPANDQIQINRAMGYEVDLVNSLGFDIHKAKIKRDRYSIDVTGLNEGIYYLRFIRDGEWFVKKMIIVR